MNGVMVVIGTNDLDEYYEMDTVPVMGDKVVCKFWKPRWAECWPMRLRCTPVTGVKPI